jgi:hypothetical protein
MAPEPNSTDRKTAKTREPDNVFAHVRQALLNLQFGTVTLVVQNGRVVQIERHEKLRLISNDPG